jgi:hypothetical protein
MSILILRRIIQRYERERRFKNGGMITGSGTSSHIAMFTPMGEPIKNRKYTQGYNEEEN